MPSGSAAAWCGEAAASSASTGRRLSTRSTPSEVRSTKALGGVENCAASWLPRPGGPGSGSWATAYSEPCSLSRVRLAASERGDPSSARAASRSDTHISSTEACASSTEEATSSESAAQSAAPREQRSGRPSLARGGATAKRGRISDGGALRPSAVFGETRTTTRTPEAETRINCIREETEAGTGESETMAGTSSRDVALACGG
eukprot:scaffold7786_cov85-Isochrysis_galbana.AAC.2